jgi:hypothetical protein
LVENAVQVTISITILPAMVERGKALIAFILERMVDDRLRRPAERDGEAQDRDQQIQSAPARQAHRLRPQ